LSFLSSAKETKIFSAVPALEKLLNQLQRWFGGDDGDDNKIDDVDILTIQQAKKNVLATISNHNDSCNESL
jgi:hypothetical protein